MATKVKVIIEDGDSSNLKNYPFRVTLPFNEEKPKIAAVVPLKDSKSVLSTNHTESFEVDVSRIQGPLVIYHMANAIEVLRSIVKNPPDGYSFRAIYRHFAYNIWTDSENKEGLQYLAAIFIILDNIKQSIGLDLEIATHFDLSQIKMMWKKPDQNRQNKSWLWDQSKESMKAVTKPTNRQERKGQETLLFTCERLKQDANDDEFIIPFIPFNPNQQNEIIAIPMDLVQKADAIEDALTNLGVNGDTKSAYVIQAYNYNFIINAGIHKQNKLLNFSGPGSFTVKRISKQFSITEFDKALEIQKKELLFGIEITKDGFVAYYADMGKKSSSK